MPRWAIVLSVAVILVGFVVGYLGLIPRGSNRHQILAVIGAAQQAADQQNWPGVLKYVADDYKDSSGLTKDDLKRMSLAASRAYEPFRIEVEVQGLAISDKARATADLLVTVQHPGDESKAQSFSVMVTFVKRRWHWVVESSEGWQGKVGDEFGLGGGG